MKKFNIGVIVIAFLLTIGVVATVSRGSRQNYVDSETQALLDLKAQNPTDKASLEILRGLPDLQERDRTIDEGQDAPREEKDEIITEKKRSLEENLRQIEAHEKEAQVAPPKLTAPEVVWAQEGIYDPYQVNFESIDAEEYKMLNFWPLVII